MKRKRYSPEFKLKVVKETIETGNGAMVARKHELNPNMVNRWVRTCLWPLKNIGLEAPCQGRPKTMKTEEYPPF
ncbi:MAG: transposase [Thermoanaerobacteraceae bacterium]|nr:transposase [Thermoanaerobacteraceae bacterium]